MKALLALAVLATTAVSYASDRAIYDIMYLPTAGTTYGITTGEYFSRKIEMEPTVDIKGFALEQTIGHSITDRLSLEAAIGYGNSEVSFANADEVEQTGLSDPRIGARFRLMDESLRFDILGGLHLGLKDSKLNDLGVTENFNNGGNSLYAGAQVGGKSESFQWALLGLVTRNFERTYETSMGDLESEANNELLLRADILNKLAESSYLRSFLSTDFVNEENGDIEVSSSTAYAIGTEYQHLVDQDLLLRAGVDYAIENSDTGSVDDDKAWIIRIGANYQF